VRGRLGDWERGRLSGTVVQRLRWTLVDSPFEGGQGDVKTKDNKLKDDNEKTIFYNYCSNYL